MQQDLKDANAQLVEERKMIAEYWEQVSRVLNLAERRRANADYEVEEKEDKDINIAKFSGAHRAEH